MKPVRSFPSSNGSRRSSPLTTLGNLISAVSNVLKRSPHFSHSRRRRIVAPSSEKRESITGVSSCWQKGQCIRKPGFGIRDSGFGQSQDDTTSYVVCQKVDSAGTRKSAAGF